MVDARQVEGVMRAAPLSCRRDAPMSVAARLMWERGAGCVAVLDGDGLPLGVITDRDVAMCAYLTGRPLSALTVQEAMSRRLITLRRTDALQSAHALMRDHRVGRLPVLDAHGQLVGLLSLGDLARAARDAPEGAESREVAATLAALTEPRATSR